jgi:hypothetical protein
MEDKGYYSFLFKNCGFILPLLGNQIRKFTLVFLFKLLGGHFTKKGFSFLAILWI